jgi:hypothetical protein
MYSGGVTRSGYAVPVIVFIDAPTLRRYNKCGIGEARYADGIQT